MTAPWTNPSPLGVLSNWTGELNARIVPSQEPFGDLIVEVFGKYQSTCSGVTPPATRIVELPTLNCPLTRKINVSFAVPLIVNAPFDILTCVKSITFSPP